MIVISCEHQHTKKFGKTSGGRQRFRCLDCGKTWADNTARPLGNMRISVKQATMALSLLLEGMSIRACERITGLDRNTLCDLVLTVGENCERFLNAKLRNVPVTEVQCDELWSFVAMKEKQRVTRNRSKEFGDSWTFVAIERNTKLVLTYEVGQRDQATCWSFMLKLNEATSGRFQITTDGLPAYKSIPFVFGMRVQFAQLIKQYAAQQEVTRYSPAKIISIEKRPLFGEPDEDRISTSHIERLNLSIRMQLRRFTRLTNAHSKSLKHHAAMQAIFFAWYNFARKHEALKGKTPAMASGLADKVWTVRELLTRAADV